jgi:hypothetical protein
VTTLQRRTSAFCHDYRESDSFLRMRAAEQLATGHVERQPKPKFPKISCWTLVCADHRGGSCLPLPYVRGCATSACGRRESRGCVRGIGFERFALDNLFCIRAHFSLDRNVCSTYIRRMKRVSLFLSEPQIAALKKLSRRSGIKASELIRRFIDEGLKRA